MKPVPYLDHCFQSIEEHHIKEFGVGQLLGPETVSKNTLQGGFFNVYLQKHNEEEE